VDYSASAGHFLTGGAVPAYWTNSIDKKYLALGSLLAAQATPANVATAQAMFPEIGLPFPNFRGQINQMLKPFPQYSGTGCFSCNLGNSSYHSMQVTINRRFAGGFFTQFAYTLSKILDTVPNGGQLGSAGGTRDPYNTALDKGLGHTDRTHILRGSFVFNPPVGRGHSFGGNNRVTRAILSDWMFSGTFMTNTGRPLAISGTCTLTGISSSCIPSYNPAFTGSTPRINGGWGDGNVLNPGATRYLDANAFMNPAPYTFGDLPRSAPFGLRAPAFWNLDMSAKREFRVTERWSFHLGVDVFNVPNVVIFDAPNTNLTSANFGQITSVQISNAPRKLQLNARITF
jgi:hypothetical protein